MKEEGGDTGFRTNIPNEQFLPSLHAITFRRNLSINSNSVVKKSEISQKIVEKLSENFKEVREKIIAVFKLILNGDSFSAEYLLLSLLSRVHTRNDGFILGNVSINMTNLTPTQSRTLSTFLKSITPFTLYFPMTLDNLDSKNLSPKKNYDTN